MSTPFGKRKIHVRKFVFTENENPDPYIDENRCN